ncbi:hypothetical protein A2U01_0075487, partial [Trifolium medium]|nr:hypothetical protein [Trifolium medium]
MIANKNWVPSVCGLLMVAWGEALASKA